MGNAKDAEAVLNISSSISEKDITKPDINDIDNCLFSIRYNACLRTIDLRVHKENSIPANNRDVLVIMDDEMVECESPLLQKRTSLEHNLPRPTTHQRASPTPIKGDVTQI